MKITNISKGPRGVNAVAGPVLIEPGDTVDVSVYEREKDAIDGSGWFETKGSFAPNPGQPDAAKVERDDNGDTPEMTEMRRRFDAAFAEQGEKLIAAEGRISELEALQKAAQNPAAPPAVTYEAKHRGAGSYSIMDSTGKEVSEKMTKEDAEAFNALSAEERAAYVAKA